MLKVFFKQHKTGNTKQAIIGVSSEKQDVIHYVSVTQKYFN